MKKLLLFVLSVLSVVSYGQSFFIQASDTTICKNTRVVFTATHPDIKWWNLQWQVNGINVGGDSAVYVTDSLHDGDSVKCQRTNVAHTLVLDSAKAITMVVDTGMPDAGFISGPTEICPGASTPLSATVSGGTWGTLNGHATATGGMLTGVSCNYFECPYPARDTVFYCLSEGFCSDTAFHSVIVNDPPSVRAELRSSWFCPFPPYDNIFMEPYCYSSTYSILVDSSKYKRTYDIFCVSTTSCGTITRQVYPRVTFYSFVQDTPQISVESLQVCEGSRVRISAPEGPYKHNWSVYNGNAAIIADSGSVYLVGVTAGTEIVSLQYSNVCGNSFAKPDTVHITVHPQPEVSAYPRAVCAGQSEVISDGVEGGRWASSNTGVLMVDSLAGIVTGTGPGTATLSHVLPTGCEAATQVEVVQCDTDISVYPVPATEQIFIHIPTLASYTNYAIIDASGRSLLQGSLVTSYTIININMLPKGSYYLKLAGNEDSKVFTIQKA